MKKFFIFILLLLNIFIFSQDKKYQEGQKIYSHYDLLYYDYNVDPYLIEYIEGDGYYTFKFFWKDKYTEKDIEVEFTFRDNNLFKLFKDKTYFIVLKCQYVKLDNVIYISPEIYYSDKKNNYRKVKSFDDIKELNI